MKSSILAILLFLSTNTLFSNPNDSNSTFMSYASNWAESKKKEIEKVINTHKSHLSNTEKKIAQLSERKHILEMSSGADRQLKELEGQLQQALASKQDLENRLAGSQKALKDAQNPFACLGSDDFSNRLKSWEAMGMQEMAGEARMFLGIAEEAKKLCCTISAYAPEAELPQDLNGIKAWLQEEGKALMPEEAHKYAQSLSEGLSEKLGNLPESMTAGWDSKHVMEYASTVSEEATKYASKVQSLSNLKAEGLKALTPEKELVSEGKQYVTYVVNQKTPVKERLFGELDLLLTGKGALAGVSPLLGMRLSNRLSMGVGAIGVQERLSGSLNGKLLTRLDIWKDLVSLDIEHITPLSGGSKGLKHRIGGRVLLPINEKFPLVLSMMRTVNDGNLQDSFLQSWQMGLGLSF